MIHGHELREENAGGGGRGAGWRGTKERNNGTTIIA